MLYPFDELVFFAVREMTHVVRIIIGDRDDPAYSSDQEGRLGSVVAPEQMDRDVEEGCVDLPCIAPALAATAESGGALEEVDAAEDTTSAFASFRQMHPDI